MSGAFTAASSMRLVNSSPPILDYPFTVGLWAYPGSSIGASSRCLWYLGSNTDGTNYYIVYWSTTGPAFAVQVANATQFGSANTGTSVTTSRWSYILARFISSTNRRISVLQPDGSLLHAQDTTTVTTPAGVTRVALGCRESNAPDLFWDGNIAEYFLLNRDIQPDGVQTADWLVRQLAYRGPFSVPGLTKDILEYRALRNALTDDRLGESYTGAKGRQTWVNTNAVKLGGGPALLGGYKTTPGARGAPCIPI